MYIKLTILQKVSYTWVETAVATLTRQSQVNSEALVGTDTSSMSAEYLDGCLYS